jgi:stage II sporulation protein D
MHSAPSTRLRPRALALALAGACLLALAAPGGAQAKKWVVKGAGFGHGVGMSQYGAYGFAKQGAGYAEILAHYYTGTTLGQTSTKTIRVLLRAYQPTVRFSGADSACGVGLVERNTYSAKRKKNKVLLRNKKGRKLANCGAVLNAAGGASITLLGKGAYRGSLQIRPSSVPGRLNAINAVGLDDYVRGVVAGESPSSWPMDALRAQAVAARSFGVATDKNGNGFDQYDDTRSQVYGGIAAETTRSNQAVSDTALQVVLYKGEVAETYYFSTSGGHTENNEFSSLGFGGTPYPYLRGVPDPYDDASPYHRWKRKFSIGKMQSLLGDLVRGRLKRIKVIKTGASPRVVKAKLVGSGGVTKASGPTLQANLALPDTWATFKKK